MFKINIARNVLNLDGSEAQFAGKPLTMRDVLVTALSVVHDGDQAVPAETRVQRIRAAQEIRVADTMVLSLTEVLALAPLIARNYVHPIILSTFIQLLEDSLKEPATTQE